jgi:TusA-related sulfurtransferase
LSLDLRGEVCPHPVMLTLEQLARMRPGQVLQVVADCPAALVNVPLEVVRHGHRLVGEPARSGPEIEILVEVGACSGGLPRQEVTPERGPIFGARRPKPA